MDEKRMNSRPKLRGHQGVLPFQRQSCRALVVRKDVILHSNGFSGRLLLRHQS
jgi:hypothetical protein